MACVSPKAKSDILLNVCLYLDEILKGRIIPFIVIISGDKLYMISSKIEKEIFYFYIVILYKAYACNCSIF